MPIRYQEKLHGLHLPCEHSKAFHCSSSCLKPQQLSRSWGTALPLVKLPGSFLILLGIGQGLVSTPAPREGVPEALSCQLSLGGTQGP